MKTSYVVGIVVIVVLIIGGIIWYMGQNSTPTTTYQQPSTMTQPDQTQPPSAATPAPATPTPSATSATPQPVSVAISNMAFNPGQISVKAGTKVTWTNSDSVSHTVTGNSGTFGSGTVAPGNTFSFTFNTPGTYSYHCKIHPSMTATVVVTQ